MNSSLFISRQKTLKNRSDALNWAYSLLKDYNLSLKILSISIKRDVSYTFAHLNDNLKKNERKKFIEIVEKLKNGIPLGYILKEEKFFDLDLGVKEGVFIPRPETEFLVNYVLNLNLKKKIKIMDIGTGSGAIAISIKKNLKFSSLFASDISLKSLFQAKKNAKKYKLKINFFCGDLFKPVKGKFDLIVSNPPYIPEEFMKKLPENVKKEPEIALNGGFEGLKIIDKILKNAKFFLKKDGFLIMEIGENQFKKIKKNGIKLGYNFVDKVKDFLNIERIISFKWSN